MADTEGHRLDLERAQRHLEAALVGATTTRSMIERLEASGRSADDARRTLQRLESVIETMSGYRRSLLLRSGEAQVLPTEAHRSTAMHATCRAPIPAPSPSSATAGLSS